MSWSPSIKLYASDGVTLIYTFEHVLDLPDQYVDNPTQTELTSLRSAGSISIPGGENPYDFRVSGVLRADGYQNLITAMSAMKTAIVANTAYVLKIDTSPTTTDDHNVKRFVGIDWRGPERKTKIQYYTVTFRDLAW